MELTNEFANGRDIAATNYYDLETLLLTCRRFKVYPKLKSE
jgi:hypothetical protein